MQMAAVVIPFVQMLSVLLGIYILHRTSLLAFSFFRRHSTAVMVIADSLSFFLEMMLWFVSISILLCSTLLSSEHFLFFGWIASRYRRSPHRLL